MGDYLCISCSRNVRNVSMQLLVIAAAIGNIDVVAQVVNNEYQIMETGSEPSPGTGPGSIMEHVVETKTLLQHIRDDIRKIGDKLDEKTDSKTVKDLKAEMGAMKNKMDQMDRRMDDLQTRINEGPMFSVTLSTARISQADRHAVIKFDNVVYNEGNHYHAGSGLFTAPVGGVYMFTSSIMADNGAELWGYIDASGVRSWIYARATGGRHDQGSQSMAVPLKAGDIVSVHGGPEVYGEHYTTFSGVLMRRL